MALLCLRNTTDRQGSENLRRSATITWFDGTWTSKWKVYTYRAGRKTVEWEEEVKLEEILTNEVVFTDSMRLSVQSKRKLLNLYEIHKR